jgi:hypothetical protein
MLIKCLSYLNYAYYIRWKGESLRESIKRHEHFLALQLGLKPGMKVSCPIEIYARVVFAALTLTRGHAFHILNVGFGCGLRNRWATKRNRKI